MESNMWKIEKEKERKLVEMAETKVCNNTGILDFTVK